MKKMLFYSVVAVLFLSLLGLGCQKKMTKVTQPEVTKPMIEKPEIEKAEKPTEETDEDAKLAKISFENILFDYDRYEIRIDARDILARHAKMLSENPKIKLLIEGHCDERGTIDYNLALGEKRANAVKKYFVAYGLNANRFSTTSYGKEKPVDSRSTAEAWAKNRRAAFVKLAN